MLELTQIWAVTSPIASGYLVMNVAHMAACDILLTEKSILWGKKNTLKTIYVPINL